MREEKLSAGSAAIKVLRDAQIAVTGGTASKWELRLPNGAHRVVDVKVLKQTPSPSVLTAMLGRTFTKPLLVIHESDSDGLTQAAIDGRVDMVNMRTGVVFIGGVEWAKERSEVVAKKQTKPAWGRWAVMRALYLSEESLTQAELAELVGVAQPRISQALREIEYVARDSHGWYSTNFAWLLNAWKSNYSGPGGTSTYWYGLDSALAQAAAAAKLTDELEVRHLLGGDVAADEFAPWRLPARGRIYVDELVDFSVINLAPAEPQDATLVATIPDDQTIWRTAGLFAAHGKLTDPLITAWDVLEGAGPDAEEAATKVLERFRR